MADPTGSEASTDAGDSATEPTRPRLRRGVSYEHPTPQKRAIGDRMRQAREIAGMSQQEVARQLGYSQQVQLSLMESGNRPVPSWVVVACSRLYGTTADYLLGLAPDADPDPVSAVQRQVAAAVIGDVRRLLREVSATGVAAVRELRQDVPRAQRMAVEILRAAQALERVRQWAAFDRHAPSGAQLVTALTAAAELAQQQVAAMQRAERLMGQRRLAIVGNACGHALDDDDDGADADLARALGPWSVPVDFDDDDDAPGDDVDVDATPAEQETPQ